MMSLFIRPSQILKITLMIVKFENICDIELNSFCGIQLQCHEYTFVNFLHFLFFAKKQNKKFFALLTRQHVAKKIIQKIN